MNKKAFGEHLNKLRNSKKLSIRKLEELSDVSNSYISQIERGEKKPSPDVLKKLAEPLGVTYDELMIKAGYIEEANSIIQKELDSTLDFLFNVITENGAFKNEVAKSEIEKLTEKFSVMFEEEEEITPESIRKALSENYDLYLKGDFIASLYDILKDSVDPNYDNELFYFLNKESIIYKGHEFTEQDKTLTINFLDALFSDRKEKE